MPDLRETLRGLDPEDAKLYSQARTEMRRLYLGIHAQVLPITAYDHNDDMVLDYIDIVMAQLFDRSGRFNSAAEGAKEPDTQRKAEIEKSLGHMADSVSQRFLAGLGKSKQNDAVSNWPNGSKQ